MVRRLEITLSQEAWDRLEAARGHEPRASFVKRALESALSGSAPKGVPGEDARVSPDRLKSDDSSSASSRAPVQKLSSPGALSDTCPGCGLSAEGDRQPHTPDCEFSRAPEKKAEPVGKVLGSNVRKAPSLRDTWGR